MTKKLMTPSDRRLLLFDIDGTLITSGGAGEQALKDAMSARFGVVEDLQGVSLAGSTDANIAVQLLRRHGLDPEPENIAALLDEYLTHLPSRMTERNGFLMPGIISLLEELHTKPEAVLGLLTGNVERGAKIKLTHYGVWHFFEFGAYADDHHDRNELGKFAQARAFAKHGEEFPPERIYVIGDTPRDIECGRAIGAQTVAIATGQYSLEELSVYKPDHLFEDFSDTAAVVQVLIGRTSKRIKG